MSKQGVGRYHRISRKINELQVIYRLLEKPYTYDELRNKTRTQGTTLSKILRLFVKDEKIIDHDLSLRKGLLNSVDLMELKIGSRYYLLNLDNLGVKQYLADQTPFYLGNYLDYHDPLGTELKKYGKDILRKIDDLSIDISPYYYCSEEVFSDVDAKVRIDFPYYKMPDKVETETTHSRDDYMKIINGIKQDHKYKGQYYQSISRKVKPHFLEFMESFIKDHLDTPYDFLIYFSRKHISHQSSDNYDEYRMYWTIMRYYLRI